MLSRNGCVGLLYLLLVLGLGCGPDTGGRVGVTGKITLKGQPLESGTIQFVSEDGSQLAGTAITNGQYELPATSGVLPGKFTVRVSAVKEGAIPQEEAPGDSAVSVENKELIPPEYNVNSTVTADIGTSSSNTFNLDIP